MHQSNTAYIGQIHCEAFEKCVECAKQVDLWMVLALGKVVVMMEVAHSKRLSVGAGGAVALVVYPGIARGLDGLAGVVFELRETDDHLDLKYAN
jgi:hypothetical protein